MIKGEFAASTIYPGTWREYWVYIPAGLDRTQPAPVMVFQDGLQYQAPVVFDNLIARKAIPPMVGVFVMHGRVKAGRDDALDRMNRSYEYDSFSDNYARFLLDEMLPFVEKTHGLVLTKDPNARAIAGNSSGAIAAFAAAWKRPDAFRRVFSAIGTYVGLRGGNNVALHVRMSEPKPIRVFLQDGKNDLNNYTGDWFIANQDMLSALTYAGYDVAHEWGDGEHNSRHATAIFPKVVEWLWKGYPAPIVANATGASKQDVTQLTILGEGWTPIDEPATAGGWVPGPDERRYAAARATKQIVARPDGGTVAVIAEHTPASALTVSHAGHVYAVDEISHTLYFVPKGGVAKQIDDTLARPGGVALSPDQTAALRVGRRAAALLRLSRPGGRHAGRQAALHLRAPHAGRGARHRIGGDDGGHRRPHLHGDHAGHPGLRSARQVPRHPADAGRGPRHDGDLQRARVQPSGRGARRHRLRAQDQGDGRPVVDEADHAAGAAPLSACAEAAAGEGG